MSGKNYSQWMPHDSFFLRRHTITVNFFSSFLCFMIVFTFSSSSLSPPLFFLIRLILNYILNYEWRERETCHATWLSSFFAHTNQNSFIFMLNGISGFIFLQFLLHSSLKFWWHLIFVSENNKKKNEVMMAVLGRKSFF